MTPSRLSEASKHPQGQLQESLCKIEALTALPPAYVPQLPGYLSALLATRTEFNFQYQMKPSTLQHLPGGAECTYSYVCPMQMGTQKGRSRIACGR